MTNQDAAKQLRMVADFIESDLGGRTKMYAHIKLTTPKTPENMLEQAGVVTNNVSELSLNTVPEKL